MSAHVSTICPSCRRGVLRPVEGGKGKLWRCEPCGFTGPKTLVRQQHEHDHRHEDGDEQQDPSDCAQGCASVRGAEHGEDDGGDESCDGSG
jgi:hypothetical protein